MKTIIISGMPASGKTTVAKIVAERLRLKALGGGEILRELARERGYHPSEDGDDWWDTQEGLKFLEERAADLNFDKKADKKMTEKVKEGNVVITSYTAPWIVDDAFKVWLDANDENRAERMAKRSGATINEMRGVIKIRDKENEELYKRLYGIEFGSDKNPFDIIINTNELTPGEVADRIVERVREPKL
jgi:CMP/dCMP kinase